MKQTPVGLIIKEVAAEKNLKVSQLAEISGKSRQGIYVTFGRSEMSDNELEEWGKTLGVSKQYLFDRWKSVETTENAGGPNYLMEHLANLEEQFKRLLNQMDVKDRQIEGLQKTVEVLLGKYKPATPLSKVKSLWPEKQTQASA